MPCNLFIYFSLILNWSKYHDSIELTNVRFLETSFDFSPGNYKIYDFEKYDINHTVLKTLHDLTPYKTVQYYKDFKQKDQSLVYTGKDYNPWNFNQIYVHAIFYERVDLYIFHNAYIQGWEQLGTKGYYYDMYDFSWVYDPIKARNNNKCNTSVGYKYVIAPIVRWLPIFGHWLTDCVCPLMYIDEWIWDLNPVICLAGVPQEMFREYMKIIGHENAVLVDRKDSFIYAETMFVIKGYAPESDSGARSLPILAEKIAEYYDLKDIKPMNYGYMNKENLNRKFTNMKELITEIENKFNLNFTLLKPNQPDRKTFAKAMASLKILVCPSGSLSFNIVMMKQGTGFLTLDSMCLDGPNIQIACHLKIWHVEVIHPNMIHVFDPKPANITRAIYSFQVLKYAVDNQRWPYNHKLYCPYNFSLFKKYLKDEKNLPQNLRVNDFSKRLYDYYLQKYHNDDL